MFSKVTRADLNLDRARGRAEELGLSAEDARSLDANDPKQFGIKKHVK